MRERRRLAAIVSADVAGYSRLMGRDESGTLAALKALRRDVVDPPIAAHGGRIVKTTGDGLLLEFPSVVGAVRCVVEIQTTMAGRGGDIAFRIGVNLGDIIIDGNDIFGDGVNIAARLEGIAEAGGVCLSDDAYRQVRGKIDLAFDDLGAQTLKNIAQPVQAWRLRLKAGADPAVSAQSPLPLPDRPSIAVLPFQNMSGDLEQEYFVDGLVEDIITALSRFKSLFVIARNSSFAYKGKAVDVRQVGRELGVRYVLEGSVRKAAGRVRITGQLIDSQTGTHLWADRFDGALEDVFDLQDRIACDVTGQLPITIERAEIDRVRGRPTNSLNAYDGHLLGMKSYYHGSRESVDEALKHYYAAIKLDPEFADPHTWAALAYSIRKQAHWMADVKRESDEGIRLARRAAALSPDDSTALGTAGFSLAYLGGETAAGIDFIDRALALNPNNSHVWHGSGWVRCYNGDHDLAVEHIGRAERLSPLDPQMAQFHLAKGMAHYCAGRYAEAASVAQGVMQRYPNLVIAKAHYARSLAMAGHVAEGRRAMAEALQLNPGIRIANFVTAIMRRPEDRARLREGYVLAGMPD